jgi:cytochrome c biogenesis protein CcmG/thiol:disulfide interchange protein DsbE
VTLLNVWATWCAACQIEQSLLMDLAKNQEIQLLGLDYKDNRATAKQYLQKNGNPYQQVLFDGEGKYAMELGIYGTPETFLIDKHGIVRYRYVGPITLDVLEKDLLPRISAIQGEK